MRFPTAKKRVNEVYVSAGRNFLTSPRRYFCLLKVLSYTSNLPLKSAMCFSKPSWLGARPCLLGSKQTYKPMYIRKAGRSTWLITHCLPYVSIAACIPCWWKWESSTNTACWKSAFSWIPVGSSGVPWLAYFDAI